MIENKSGEINKPFTNYLRNFSRENHYYHQDSKGLPKELKRIANQDFSIKLKS
jgi:hypothetical protein